MHDLKRVQKADITAFREMVEAYWLELMPRADVLSDPSRKESYFTEQLPFDDESRQSYWALADGNRVGFVSFDLNSAAKRAYIENFYVIPRVRRTGIGSDIVKRLLSLLDSIGVEQIDLNVRRDNPGALAFREKQGFRLAGYRLGQYRDPATSFAYTGVISSDEVFYEPLE